MSSNWVADISRMHNQYGFNDAVRKLSPEALRTYIKFRLDFIKEELNETYKALDEKNPEEIVDGLIDICVVAIGTLDLYDIDSHFAWNRVLNSNLNKEVGIKPSRPNPLNLPDLIKPSDWEGPDHSGNHGIFGEIFKETE